MESLLCDEVCLMSPNKKEAVECSVKSQSCPSSLYTTREDTEEALNIYIQKECIYMPETGYVDRLKPNNLVDMRLLTVHWLVKAGRRMKLSVGTVFCAANYLDRFISRIDQCHLQGWKKWVFELISIACLSVASKFGETDPPPLDEIQMEGLENAFERSMIQNVELRLVDALEWRLNSTTPYSYLELLLCNIDAAQDFTTLVSDLLLTSLLDIRFLEFRPSIVASSAVKCILEELQPSTFDTQLSYICSHIPHDQKESLLKCHKIMVERSFKPTTGCTSSDNCPASPITVLTGDRPVNMHGCKFDLSLLTMPRLITCKMKRKRED